MKLLLIAPLLLAGFVCSHPQFSFSDVMSKRGQGMKKFLQGGSTTTTPGSAPNNNNNNNKKMVKMVPMSTALCLALPGIMTPALCNTSPSDAGSSSPAPAASANSTSPSPVGVNSTSPAQSGGNMTSPASADVNSTSTTLAGGVTSPITNASTPAVTPTTITP